MTTSQTTMQMLAQAIEFSVQNHRVISQNLANVNTPDYLARQLSFADFLSKAEQNGPAEAGKQFQIELVQDLVARSDGNNVDLDRELANLKRNDLFYQALAQMMGAKLDMMKTAIRG